jgi:hypothetical protein
VGSTQATDAISISWSAADVREVRPDLTPDQCPEVLREVEDRHDASVGINWDIICKVADRLYPEPGDSSGDDG